jgi:TatD DNase family protein
VSALLVDTHAHLSSQAFEPDRAAIVAEALSKLVYVVDVGVDLASSKGSLALARSEPRIFATTGVHPHDAKAYQEAELADVFALADDPRVVALGEMGLDYHYDFSPREEQRRVFARQVAEARVRKKPVVVHIRDAFEDALAILGEHGALAGVLHCFTGNYAQACAALDLGLYISFSGVVTFKNAGELREVAAKIPGDRLVVETDSPYLAPHPKRNQKRNTPVLVEITAALVAEVRGEPYEQLARRTTANACRLFGLPPPEGA